MSLEGWVSVFGVSVIAAAIINILVITDTVMCRSGASDGVFAKCPVTRAARR